MTEIFDWGNSIRAAALPIAILNLLQVRELHGYKMGEALSEYGFTDVKGATVYPILRRLESGGLITFRWDHEGQGPGRKVSSLTDGGLHALAEARSVWQQVHRDIQQIADARGTWI